MAQEELAFFYTVKARMMFSSGSGDSVKSHLQAVPELATGRNAGEASLCQEDSSRSKQR